MKHFFLFLAVAVAFIETSTAKNGALSLSTFVVDVTPPVGSPLCFSNVKPAATIEAPLTARGIVLFGSGKPIVLCVADYVVIANESHDRWREALAQAAGTESNRVSMHVIHNHDSPGYDVSAMKLLEKRGLTDVMARRSAHDEAIEKTAEGLRSAMAERKPITHFSTASAVVREFASNRRLLGSDGKVVITRFSASRKKEAIAAPEGVIDPELDMIVFWSDNTPIAALSFYASHPQSYYGRGGITPDTVGLARNRRQEETGVVHIHFDGAGGNVAAGKYNDGSPEARQALTQRIETAMGKAWESQVKAEVSAKNVSWIVAPTELPWRGRYTEEELTEELSSPKTSVRNRIRAARDLVFYRRWKEGRKIDINCLKIAGANLLFFPGELFVEYQLAAKAMRPEDFVTVAAYGDGGPGYIGTAISYEQGGYEVSRVSLVGPTVEQILTETLRKLLTLQPD